MPPPPRAYKLVWNRRGGVYPLPMLNPPPSFHPGGDKPLPYEGKNVGNLGGWAENPKSEIRNPKSVAHRRVATIGSAR